MKIKVTVESGAGNARVLATTHLLFLRFSCGHEYFVQRIVGGSDWEYCLCESCQPYHGMLIVEHPCLFCGGSFDYRNDGLQVGLTEVEVKEELNRAVPLFGSRDEKQKVINCCQSS